MGHDSERERELHGACTVRERESCMGHDSERERELHGT